jgi:NADH:ubiquinone oxidoreductase subunit 3 (subunit A)
MPVFIALLVMWLVLCIVSIVVRVVAWLAFVSAIGFLLTLGLAVIYSVRANRR